ncbi:hypothetical protein GUITHDRAFT_83848 [Guillardia theta CCMP2712]|uniref:[RNA-polymerase]-subunit kinase n=1 Tax=Guillardia theta (strain CCMP2712) TaxID=905079 RepID=L1K2U0_GUITC|nr:hypothetical protein GUITHDRAFT_83848 [Guillardia theta CCMP2712]EKX54892.1 hypothetical protein GUITHDRAFT_83848 [Guillardia theta CCMP2712]|eukprot:XP_005841872.1 hypothetical protein GUITHDRAFT_83848 [Guillardia theta CCMP2712]
MGSARKKKNPRKHYKVLHEVGRGTFGVVCKAIKKKTGEEVAIKNIKLVHKIHEGVSTSAIDEIRIMQELHHPNVLSIHEVFSPREGTLSLVLDFIPMDMEMIIKAKDMTSDKYVPMPSEDIKAYMQMFLRGINACHQNFVLHRDLKPANLLLSANGVLKLCDFGLARTYGSPNAKFSPQAVTLWYRPLEMLLGADRYGPAVDMWGVGCIFAEMLLRNPLFPTGRGATDVDQVCQIVRCMGAPTERNWPGFDQLPILLKFQQIPPTPLARVIPAAPKDALDLLDKLLSYDPNKRISAEEALKHEYFRNAPAPASTAQIADHISVLIKKPSSQVSSTLPSSGALALPARPPS